MTEIVVRWVPAAHSVRGALVLARPAADLAPGSSATAEADAIATGVEECLGGDVPVLIRPLRSADVVGCVVVTWAHLLPVVLVRLTPLGHLDLATTRVPRGEGPPRPVTRHVDTGMAALLGHLFPRGHRYAGADVSAPAGAPVWRHHRWIVSVAGGREDIGVLLDRLADSSRVSGWAPEPEPARPAPPAGPVLVPFGGPGGMLVIGTRAPALGDTRRHVTQLACELLGGPSGIVPSRLATAGHSIYSCAVFQRDLVAAGYVGIMVATPGLAPGVGDAVRHVVNHPGLDDVARAEIDAAVAELHLRRTQAVSSPDDLALKEAVYALAGQDRGAAERAAVAALSEADGAAVAAAWRRLLPDGGAVELRVGPSA